MITLITGTPGAGKTLWTVNEIDKLLKREEKDAKKENGDSHTPRATLWVHGIKKLKIPHIPVYCHSPLCDLCRSQDEEIKKAKEEGKPVYYVDDWQEWACPGSLIVIDEVQRIWRPRGSSQKLPEAVAGLETHRHYGIDFWLISQGPHLFDNFIRLLVGRHIHLVAKWNKRFQYEWPECKQDVTSRTDATVFDYKLPKHIYGMYHSAEVHTKLNLRTPKVVYFVAAIIPVALFAVYHSFTSVIMPKLSPDKPAIESKKTDKVGVDKLAQTAIEHNDLKLTQVSQEKTYFDFEPKIKNVPESAPAYSGLFKVESAPILGACIKIKDKCSCYTHQATPYPSSHEFCEEMVKGHYFNPYSKPVVVQPFIASQVSQDKHKDNIFESPLNSNETM
ncbi:zonular occludens toxin domain-containing protein [Methylomonas sp. HYX-M1]|uniref:zonular occludens toxin domain-containing protein n=1 Tax=Methylomonas sp. HYX-M1 TaxID=3139307 RepID=UPI00345BB4CD